MGRICNKFKRQPLVEVDESKLIEPDYRYFYVQGPIRADDKKKKKDDGKTKG